MTTRGKVFGFSGLGLGLVALLIFVGLPAFANATAGCFGYKAQIEGLLNSCPLVTEALGDDVSFSKIGVACGSSETSGGLGEAQWRMPISGSKGRGVVSFSALKRGDDWRVVEAKVKVDGETIDALSCNGRRDPASGIGESSTGQSVESVLKTDCDKGQATACHSLGSMFEDGVTVEKDAARAAEYYKRACALGFKPACYPAEKEPQ